MSEIIPPPYNVVAKTGKELEPVKGDGIDDIVNAQLKQGQSLYLGPDRCPNPQHTMSEWHGFVKDNCPGSHLDDYPETENTPKIVAESFRERFPVFSSFPHRR